MQPTLPSQRPAWPQRLLDWWLGTDWFVSYAWVDGHPLATALHGALTESGLRVFLDRRSLRAGEPIADSLASALRRARGLIVIGTAGAVGNGWVRAEIEMARALALPIVPIDVGGALAADAAAAVAKLPLGDLLRISHDAPEPDADLLAAIESRRRGERAEAVQRRALLTTVLVLLGLLSLVAVLAMVARTQRDLAVRERDVSQANELAVRSQLSQEDDPVTAARLAVTAADRTAGHDLITPAVLQQLRASLLDGTPLSAGNRRIVAAAALPGHFVAITDTCRVLIDPRDSPGTWSESGAHLQSVNAIATVGADAAMSMSLGGELLSTRLATRSTQRVGVLPPRSGESTTLRTALAVDVGRRRVAVGDSEGWLQLHPIDGDWAPGPPSRLWRGHDMLVTDLGFTASGELVSASLDGLVRQWSLAVDPPQEVSRHEHRGGVRALEIGEDDAIASGGLDGAVILRRPGQGTRIVGRHAVAVFCLQFVAKDVLVSGDARGDLGVWRRLDTDEFRALDRQVLRGGGADAVALQTLGEHAVRLLGDDGAVREFDLAEGSLVHDPVRFGTGSDMGSVLVAANSEHLLLASPAQDCRWVDLADPTKGRTLLPPVRAIAATQDLARLAWVTKDGTWAEAAQSRGAVAPARHLGTVRGEQPLLAIGHSGRLVAIVDDDGLRVVRDGAAPITVPLPEAANWLHALARRDALLIGGCDGTFVVVDAGQRCTVRKHQAKIRAGAVDTSERWALTGDEDGRLMVWDLAPASGPRVVGEPIVVAGEQFYAIACARELPRFVAAGHSGTLTVVEVGADGLVATQQIAAATSTVAVAASADGDLVACASFTPPNRVLVFDLRQPGSERLPDIFPAGPDSLTHVEFVPGGKWLLAHDASGTVRLWRRDPQEVLRHARARLPLETSPSK